MISIFQKQYGTENAQIDYQNHRPWHISTLPGIQKMRQAKKRPGREAEKQHDKRPATFFSNDSIIYIYFPFCTKQKVKEAQGKDSAVKPVYVICPDKADNETD